MNDKPEANANIKMIKTTRTLEETDGAQFGHQPHYVIIEKGYQPPAAGPMPPNPPVPTATDPVWRPPAETGSSGSVVQGSSDTAQGEKE